MLSKMLSNLPTWFTYGIIGLVALLYVLKQIDARKYKNIPAIGPTFPIISLLGALRWYSHARDMVDEGYRKYRGGAFRVRLPTRWQIIVTSPKIIEELRRAPDDVLSFDEAITQIFQIKYTIGPSLVHNNYHIPIIRTILTRNLGVLFENIQDELVQSCNDILPASDDWVKVHALPAIMKIVARTSSRVFVGLPLCRNEDYNKINIGFAIDVILFAVLLNLFPDFVRPIVAPRLVRTGQTVRRTQAYLEPIIQGRYRCMEKYGQDWQERPNDMLQWLMDDAVGEEKSPELLTVRMLTVSFAAIHTSTMSFTYALYRLAANPDYAQPLREEVEQVVKEEGWSKTAMHKMRKIDSFLKESQRIDGLSVINMTRKAMKDYTFSDGTTIPKGAFVSVATSSVHVDDDIYDDPKVFNPWRFSDMRDDDGEATKHQMTNTSVEYVSFGMGRHACPGRFFAANELKCLLAHIVMNYDVKMEKDGYIPPPVWWTNTKTPNREAKVLFRKRQA